MLKKCTIWLFLFAVLTANFSGLFVYAGFQLNQKYITTTLCENRDKPWLHCDGKCYLMKKVLEAEKNENNKTAKSNLSNLGTSFFQRIYTPSFRQTFTAAAYKRSFPNYTYLYSNHYINSIFRPPKFTA